MTVADLLAKAGRVLNDAGATRWTATELVGWLNDGCTEIVRLKPAANAVSVDISLVSGAVQNLPADLLAVLRFVAILDASSVIVGAPTITTPLTLDMLVPGWQGGATVAPAEIDTVAYDHDDPLRCYVFAPSNGTGKLRLLYGQRPAAVEEGGNFPLAEHYVPMALDYVLYRALSKDDPATEDSAADKAYQKFATALAA